MDVQEHVEGLIRDVTSTLLGGEISKDDFFRAENNLETVMTIDRDNPGLPFLLGSLYMRVGRLAMAEHWLWRSINMKPDFNEAYNNLGFVCQQEGRQKEAIGHFQKALELKPDCVEIINNVATQYVNNGTPDKAIEVCEQALALDPKALDPQWNKALALLEKGEWKEGWEGYRVGLALADSSASTQHRKVRHYGEENAVPYWEGTADKSVAIYGEQGVGDEIMGMSMLPDAIGNAQVVLEAHPRLVNLARLAFGEQIPIYGTRKANWRELSFVKWHKVDAKCPILNLGGLYRNEASAFPKTPYMKPFPHLVERFGNQLSELGPKPKIGISWKGGSVRTRNDLRSIPLNLWEELLKSYPEVDWVSLQYDQADQMGHNAPIAAGFSKHTGIPLHHWQDAINDLDYCYGGLIHALDLVISVNTSLVHACGAMGVRCWSLTPSRPAWRYGLQGREMPWYGSHVQLYRQKGDDWGKVFDKVKVDLHGFLGERSAA